MADSQAEIRNRVRTLTDYDAQIIPNPALDDVINAAEDEIRSDLGDPTLVFYQGNDTFDLDLAVFWLSALFAKVRAGEIDAPTMSLGDIRTDPPSGSASIWLERFERAIKRVDDAPGHGQTNITRDNRTYGESF